MFLVTDIRTVSESAVEQLADRFDELPRPLLAAIGAGDLAVEQWAALRESLLEQVTVGTPHGADAAAFAADLSTQAQRAAAQFPGMVQQAATDYASRLKETSDEYVGRARDSIIDLPDKAKQGAGDLPAHARATAAQVTRSVGSFGTQMPAKAQQLLGGFSEKIVEFSGGLTVETMRDTVDAYAELVGLIYGSLADRGERTWSRVRSSPLRPGTIVDATSQAPESAEPAPKAAAPKAAAPKAAAPKAAAPKAAAPKRATTKAGTPKSAASKSTTRARPRAASTSTGTAAGAAKPATGRSPKKPTDGS